MGMRNLRNLLALLIGLSCVVVPAATGAAQEEVPVILRPPGPLVIDGRLEDAWYVTQPLVLMGWGPGLAPRRDTAPPTLVINELRQVVFATGRRRPEATDEEVLRSWKGPQTLSGRIYLRMDEESLYLGAEVTDDNPLANHGTKGGIFDGCGLELYFGGQSRRNHPEITTPTYAPFEYQVELGLDQDGQPVIWFGPQAPSWERGTSNGPAVGGELAAVKRPDGTGYVLEARIPLSNFRFTPKAGVEIEIDLGLNHAGRQPGPDGKVHRDLQMMWHGDFDNCATTKAWGRAYVWAPPLPGQAAAAAAPPAVQATVEVAGDTVWEINGYRTVPKELFGVRVVSEDRLLKDRESFVALLREAGFESFFCYFHVQNISREWEDPARPGHLKPEVFEHPEQAYGDQLVGQVYDTLRLVNPYGTYELCLQTPADWLGLKPIPNCRPAPADPEEYARSASALLKVYESDPRGPGKQVKFVSFLNEPEPFGHWASEEWKDDPTAPVAGYNGEKGLDYYIKTFNAVSQRLKADFPGLSTGGYGRTGASSSEWDEILPSNLWRAEGDQLIPQPVFYLYRALRDLRGPRLWARTSRPELAVRAARYGNRLSAVLFNDAGQEATVQLALTLPVGAQVGRVLVSGWDYDGAKNEFLHFEDREITAQAQDGKLSLPVTLTPFATRSLVVELTGAPRASRLARTTEYYADRVFAEQAAETKPVFKIALPAPARRAQSLTLRLGWEGPKPAAVQVGARKYPVPDQRREITDIKVAEIRLQANDLASVTEVRPLYEKTYPEFNEKILFATIVATEVEE